MPKDTFNNLPEEKRQKIIDAAMLEFEINSFDHASINQIISTAQISKGSFYQYFEDKKDLYKYIIQLMIQEKMRYITPAMQNPFAHGFFEVIRDMNQSGLNFAKNHPRFTKIGHHLLRNPSHPIFQEIMIGGQEQAYKSYEMLLTRAIEKGEVRSDIDVSFTARMIFKLSSEFILEETDLTAENWTEGLTEMLNKFMALLENGIKAK